MMNVLLVAALAIIAGLVVLVLYGTRRWEAGTLKLRSRLEAARVPIRPPVVDFGEIEGLPLPVQRYFLATLQEGQPMVAGAQVRHRGTFNLSETRNSWKRFTSDQKVLTRRPGFDWDARVFAWPGVPLHIHDAYVGGEGILRAALFGLVPLLDLHGSRDLAEGELMRFFAEAVWYPTALLPSQGVSWKEVDEGSAYGTLRDGVIDLTLLFTFTEEGLIDTVSAEARGRTVGDEVVRTPWSGRFWNYDERNGMRVPLDGEVAWITPDGPKPYWRGHLLEITHEFAGEGGSGPDHAAGARPT